jgi:hypothetical protein
MDICRMLGLSDKKQYDYTPRNIRNKAVNLLIRLGSMIALNRIVSKCNVVEKMIDSYSKDDIKKCELTDCLYGTRYAKAMKDNIKSIKVGLYYLKLAPCREIAKRIPSLFGC